MTSSFHLTHWTLVLRSRGDGQDAQAALSELCEIYYEPVVMFLRRQGRKEDEARELAHVFFQELLNGGLGKPDPTYGKFRSYLLGALKKSLAKKYNAGLAAKRGAGADHISLTSAGEAGVLPAIAEDDILEFDREWALALIGRALQRLEEENQNKAEQFKVLRPWLDGKETIPQTEVAKELGVSKTAVKVAIHRLRVRFRELIRKEVGETVSQPSEVTEELRHLINVVSHNPPHSQEG